MIDSYEGSDGEGGGAEGSYVAHSLRNLYKQLWLSW